MDKNARPDKVKKTGDQNNLTTSGKYARAINAPLKPHFYIVKVGFAGVYLFFLFFAPKHRLWVLVRTTIYVLSKNKKNNKFLHLKMFNF